MSKTRAVWVVVSAMLVVGGVRGYAVEELVESEVWAPREITNLDTSPGVGSIQSEAYGAVTVNFVDRSGFPQEGSCLLAVGGSPEASEFAGNYTAAGIEGISFRIKSSIGQIPDHQTRVLLWGNSNPYSVMWSGPSVVVSESPGEWAQYSISLDREEGGWATGTPEKYVDWEDDLTHVYMVGIKLVPGSSEAQALTVDDFVLVGDGFTTTPATLIPILAKLRARFNRGDIDSMSDLTAGELAADADGDGLTDVEEILAGTDADDAGSRLMAEIVSTDPQAGITIRWKAVGGNRYTVSRSSSLTDDSFDTLADPAANEQLASEDGYMSYTDETVVGTDGPYFYRITKK